VDLTMAVELIVPEVGESITEVMIGRWLKNEGEPVEKDEGVVEIETDKVTLELPAPATGTVTQQLKQQGDEASVGDTIGYMEEGQAGGSGQQAAQAQAGGESKAEPASSTATAEKESAAQGQPPAGKANGQAGATADKIMPAAQRLLDEHGLSANDVTVEPTGKGGRLLKQDVQRHLKQQEAATSQAAATQGQTAPPAAPAESEPAPQPAAAPEDAAAGGDRVEETVPMTPMRRRIAQRLVQVQQQAALLTTFNEVDMSQIMGLRSQYKDQFSEQYGIKLGFMSFFVKAAVDALKRFPAINAEIRENNIVYKNYYDIGIAVSTDKGLVVPVLRNAEKCSFAEIENAIVDFGKRAHGNQLSLDELQGGTFTITNGGVFGSLLSTPIVNPPQSAVLGMHTIQKRPVAINDEVKIRPMMYIALTYDHRIVDGREAVTFLRRIKEACEDPTRMLMEV
jgi:2-oxoglutarate dehydrogenase E2 component (dihydrolipoamide succinyltransferase)